MRIDYHRDAAREAVKAHQWYAKQSPRAAAEFEVELRAATERIARSPESCAQYLYGTRYSLLHRFPFLVVFRTAQESIQVIAVAHAKRKPGYWRKRQIE